MTDPDPRAVPRDVRRAFERREITGGKGFSEVGIFFRWYDYDCPVCGAELSVRAVVYYEGTSYGRFVCDGDSHDDPHVWILGWQADGTDHDYTDTTEDVTYCVYDAGGVADWD